MEKQMFGFNNIKKKQKKLTIYVYLKIYYMSLSKQLQGDRNIVKEKKAERTKLHLNNKIYKTIK